MKLSRKQIIDLRGRPKSDEQIKAIREFSQFTRQQSEVFVPDWIGGSLAQDLLTAQTQSTAAAFTSSVGIPVSALTGKLLILVDISAVSGNTFSIQLFSAANTTASGGVSFGSALVPTVIGTTLYSVDLESFTNAFMYATLTLGGGTHTATFSVVTLGSKKIV